MRAGDATIFGQQGREEQSGMHNDEAIERISSA